MSAKRSSRAGGSTAAPAATNESQARKSSASKSSASKSSANTPDGNESPGKQQGKGRPTRTRKEAEAARRRPLVVTDRKEAKRRDREKAQHARMQAQQAMITNDEAHMPLQHRGKQRRYVRDVVDSRHNVGEYFFPVAMLLLLLNLLIPLIRPDLYLLVNTIMMVLILAGFAGCIIDGFALRRRLRYDLTEMFGEMERGLVSYGVLRQLQIRPLRMPKPAISHGEAPRR